MAVELAFYVNLNTGALSKNSGSYIPYSLPKLIAGDTVYVRIGVVRDAPTGRPGELNRVPISGWSCKIAVGTENSTPLTSSTLSVIQDTDYLTDYVFSGTLPLNVAALTSLFTGAETITRTFEMEFTDGTGIQTVKSRVTIQDELIDSTLQDPPATDTALGKLEAANLYLKRGENDAGAGFILVSPDGTQKAYIYLDNQGQLQVSPLT